MHCFTGVGRLPLDVEIVLHQSPWTKKLFFEDISNAAAHDVGSGKRELQNHRVGRPKNPQTLKTAGQTSQCLWALSPLAPATKLWEKQGKKERVSMIIFKEKVAWFSTSLEFFWRKLCSFGRVNNKISFWDGLSESLRVHFVVQTPCWKVGFGDDFLGLGTK